MSKKAKKAENAGAIIDPHIMEGIKKYQEEKGTYKVEYEGLIVPNTLIDGGVYTQVLKDGYEVEYDPEAFEKHIAAVFKNLAAKHSKMKSLEEKKEVKKLADYLNLKGINEKATEIMNELREKELEKYPELKGLVKLEELPKEEVKMLEPMEIKSEEKKADTPKKEQQPHTPKNTKGIGKGGKKKKKLTAEEKKEMEEKLELVGFRHLINEGTTEELMDLLRRLCRETPKGSVSKIKKLKARLTELGWKPIEKNQHSKAKGKGGSRISKRALKRREEKQLAHVKRTEAAKAKAKEDRKFISILIDGAKQPYVKQSQPKGTNPLKGKGGLKLEGKKARLKRIREEYAVWNKTHMEELEKLRKESGEVKEYSKIPRKFKKRHTQKRKDRYAKYPKVSNTPKKAPVDHYSELLKTIEKRNERLSKGLPVTHKVEGKSQHSLVCITDGTMVHRVPRQLAELIIERVVTKKGDAIWKYTTKGTWKSARANGNAGYGFDPVDVKTLREESEARRKEKQEKRHKTHINIVSRNKRKRWDEHPRKKFLPTTKTKKKGKVSKKDGNFQG